MEIIKITKVLYNNKRVVVKNIITTEILDEDKLLEDIETEQKDNPNEQISAEAFLYYEQFVTVITFSRGDTWDKVITENKNFLGLPSESVLSKVILHEGFGKKQSVFNPAGKIPSPFPE